MNFKFSQIVLCCFLIIMFVEQQPACSFAQVPSYVPSAGLLAWYSFNSNLLDGTGGGSNGVAYGAVTYSTDRFGAANSCYKGNGASDVDVPVHNYPLGNSARSVTVFFQFSLPYLGGGRQFIAWGNNSFGQRFGLFASDTYIGVEYTNGYVKHNFTPDLAWHNLTVTYPPGGSGSSSVKLYIDGCLVSNDVVLPVATFNTVYGTFHNIGGSIYYLPSYVDSWTGKLDDIGVWNRELTAAEVAQIWAASPPLISGPTSICAPGAITLTATVVGGTWSSSVPSVATVGSSSGIVNGLSSGTTIISYSVTNFCGTVTDTQMVTVNPLPNVGTITGPTSLCVGASVTLTDATTGGTWSSSVPSVAIVGSSSGMVTGLTVGTTIISYSVTNACGTAVDTQMVTVSSMPNAGTIAGPTSVCVGSTIALIDPATGGTWTSSVPSVATVGSGSGIVGGVTAGNTIISYSVTNACGTATDTQMVVVRPLPNAGTIMGPTSVCMASSIILTDAATGGTWSSSSPGNASIGSGSGVVNGLTAGTAIISYSVTNSCGTAIDTQMVTINVSPNAGTITGLTNVCVGSSIALADAAPGGTWGSSAIAIASISSSSGTVFGLTAGSTIISYSVTNACGTAIDTQMIVVHPLPNAGIISNPPVLCVGALITLTNTVTGGTWSSTNMSVATINSISGVAQLLSGGTTTIVYTTSPNAFGCVNDTSVLLTSGSSMTINSTITKIKCNGDSNGGIDITVTNGSGSYQYTWSNGSTSASISSLTSGTYTVVIKDNGTNCIDTESYSLLMPVPLAITSTVQNDLCYSAYGRISLVNVFGGVSPYTYLWSTGATTTEIHSLAAGDYTVSVTDNNLCTRHFVITVIEDSCDEVVIPDVITPNGDGKNDVWVLEGIGKHPGNTVQVFDKWGDIVLDAHDYNNDWGGESKGKGSLLPDGTYFYLIKLNSSNLPEEKNIMKGSLLIKR